MMLELSFEQHLLRIPTVTIGGLPISVIDRRAAAELMLQGAREHRRGQRPLFFTSANGEVIARAARNPEMGGLFAEADQILADGQPLVVASRHLCKHPLPERVATTDLFHDVAERAEITGETFYLFGATAEENEKAVATVRAAYPRLRIVGHSHGYLEGEALEAMVTEIDALAPDILWLGLGVPHEQRFFKRFADRLTHVGVVKTSGGLFNYLSGRNPRAPRWMQRMGLEWVWRMALEPRRLAWRYLTTNPQAIYVMLRHSA